MVATPTRPLTRAQKKATGQQLHQFHDDPERVPMASSMTDNTGHDLDDREVVQDFADAVQGARHPGHGTDQRVEIAVTVGRDGSPAPQHQNMAAFSREHHIQHSPSRPQSRTLNATPRHTHSPRGRAQTPRPWNTSYRPPRSQSARLREEGPTFERQHRFGRGITTGANNYMPTLPDQVPPAQFQGDLRPRSPYPPSHHAYHSDHSRHGNSPRQPGFMPQAADPRNATFTMEQMAHMLRLVQGVQPPSPIALETPYQPPNQYVLKGTPPVYKGEDDHDGADAEDFLWKWEAYADQNRFQTSKAKAIKFGKCFKPRSAAEGWYDELDDDVKNDYEALMEAFKNQWVLDVKDGHKALATYEKMDLLRLRDTDVGKKNSNGKEEQVVYADTMKRHFSRLKDVLTPGLKALILTNNCGPGLQKIIKDKFPNLDLRAIHHFLCNLTAADIQAVRQFVHINNQMTCSATTSNKKLGTAASRGAQSTPSTSETTRKDGATDTKTAEVQKQYAPTTAEQDLKVIEWEKKNAGRTPTMQSLADYPWTPGTKPPGTMECWTCGSDLHLARDCDGLALRDRETDLRKLVARMKREEVLRARGIDGERAKQFRTGANAIGRRQDSNSTIGINWVQSSDYERSDDDVLAYYNDLGNA